jgi:hypothetical protein
MPVRVADPSAPNIQAGEKRGEIAAHKYEGLTIFQRTSPRSRSGYGDAAVCKTIHVRSGLWRSGMSPKEPDKETISVDISLQCQL